MITIAKDKISEQLQALGVQDIGKFKLLIEYHGDRTNGGYGDRHWSNIILDVVEQDAFIVVLFNEQTWCHPHGAGIEMSTHLEMIFSEKHYHSEKIVYRNEYDSRQDRFDRAFSKIVSIIRHDDKFSIRLRTNRGIEEEIKIAVQE